MSNRVEDLQHRTGDKVRISRGHYAKERGIIQSTADDSLWIELTSGAIVNVAEDQITNYSLAARRAWKIRPKQAGRPKLDDSAKKKMVSLRLDPEMWARLGRAVELGMISNREKAVNSWLVEKVAELFGEVAATYEQDQQIQGEAQDGERNREK